MARIDFVAVWLKIFYSAYQNNNDDTVWDGLIGFFPFLVLKAISEMEISPPISYNYWRNNGLLDYYYQ